jgi:adenylate kinase family enzyme
MTMACIPLRLTSLGAPGAGKGTLAKRLAKDNDFTHISVGDMLRGKVDDNAAVAWHVKNSELLPPEHLFPLLQEEFRDSPPTCPIILDGFPRNADQMRKFEKRVSCRERVPVI